MAMFVYNEKIENIAKEARLAKTTEELADVCRRLNIADSIFLGQVDLWLAKLALSAVYRTLKKYPYLRDSINYFGTLNGFIQNKDELFARLNRFVGSDFQRIVRNSTDDIAKNCRHAFENNGLALAFYVGGTCSFSGIIINGKSFNEQSVLANLEYGEKVGHSPQGCKTIKSAIEHEIGHIWDALLGISNSKEFANIVRNYSTDEIRKGLSSYCVMNNVVANGEVIAEGYSEYCNNPQPRAIALQIGQLIEQKYKEKFKR